MSWYKKADKLQQFIDKVVEDMLWLIQIGEIENVYELMDRIKTNYRDNTPPNIYDGMVNGVCERLKDELV